MALSITEFFLKSPYLIRTKSVVSSACLVLTVLAAADGAEDDDHDDNHTHDGDGDYDKEWFL